MPGEWITGKRILFALAGDATKASSRVRGFWIADELGKRGNLCTLFWKRGRLALIALAYEILKHDIVVFQKTYSRYHRWLMAFAKRLGKRAFIDIDDFPSRVNSPVTLANFAAMCRMADGVFAGSNNLVAYVKQYQPEVYLIPSSIKLEYYQPSKRRSDTPDRLCLGWIGNGMHYKRDLIDILSTPLAELTTRYRLRFKIVGACGVRELYETFGAIPNLEIDFIDEIEWSNPWEVCKSISDFDVGLYPLLSHGSNHYKCGFKALEYMSMAIPVVASPVGANVDIVEDGKTGYLVDAPYEWTTRLEELVVDSRSRIEMGRLARSKVESEFSIQATAAKVSGILGLEG